MDLYLTLFVPCVSISCIVASIIPMEVVNVYVWPLCLWRTGCCHACWRRFCLCLHHTHACWRMPWPTPFRVPAPLVLTALLYACAVLHHGSRLCGPCRSGCSASACPATPATLRRRWLLPYVPVLVLRWTCWLLYIAMCLFLSSLQRYWFRFICVCFTRSWSPLLANAARLVYVV